ncbi:hypothetical protein FACS1894152_8630 [Bacilli bacterium]|nr:hypothetical protein FACS1894152_8630 [Bacilli bacterium]
MEILNDALSTHNIPVPDKTVANGEFTRWGKGYWAKSLYDGFIFGDWVKGTSEKVFPKQKSEYSKKEWRKRMEECKKIREEEEKNRMELQEETSKKALVIWNSLPTVCNSHPYLQRKKVKPIGLRYDSETKEQCKNNLSNYIHPLPCNL